MCYLRKLDAVSTQSPIRAKKNTLFAHTRTILELLVENNYFLNICIIEHEFILNTKYNFNTLQFPVIDFNIKGKVP